MLRTNLSTRPFYNERAVRLAIGVAALLVAALTAFNVQRVLALNARHDEMSRRAEEAEQQSGEYRKNAQAVRQSLNTAEMTAVQQAAQEANLLIGRRVFSWTDLFNQFERTLPAEVRIAAVEPQVDNEGRLLVAITVLSRSVEDLNEFMDQLETSGRFRDVLNRQDTPMDDGLMRSVVQGYYDPTREVPASPPAPASDSPGVTANESPARPANGSAAAPRGER